MANTYSQITIHIIFTVKNRECILKKELREKLYGYITGILKNENQKPLAIGGMSDHVHLLVGINPDVKISDLVKTIKSNTSRWINDNKYLPGKFSWQEGYGAFSYSKSQREVITNYIQNQEAHHKTKTFKEEYVELLKKFEIDFEEKYLFAWME